ncbi:DUF4226 domain-containing protein [Nocardia uniformis]|uniref:DUF4226 domain-containing protein n=1 Tax=Nocardia uniformis TaxID=53432 RepID=A0A849BS85_9NOCA|nr:NlpC/P60 family protein [Nocardia uniformis]NNH69492.1 DUF4226 domain-containing protein [Nocardia uniformis]
MTSVEPNVDTDAVAEAEFLTDVDDVGSEADWLERHTPWSRPRSGRGGSPALPSAVPPASPPNPSSTPGVPAAQQVSAQAPALHPGAASVLSPGASPVSQAGLTAAGPAGPLADTDYLGFPRVGDRADPDLGFEGPAESAQAFPFDTLLPALESALSGLGAPGSGARNQLTDTTLTATDGEPATVALTPNAEQALQALNELAALYGAGNTTTPTAELPGDTADSGGTGAGAAGYRAAAAFSKFAKGSFRNLDNKLANYVTNLAGANTVDRKALLALIRETNVALAAVGPDSYTAAGQRKVHEILSRALQYAHKLVGTGQGNSAAAAAHINQLTNGYLYNLAGQNAPAVPTFPSGGSGDVPAAAQHAIKVALAQTGKPYVWGAEGPGSFDCSGLMRYAVSKAGGRIPRVAADQYRQGHKIHPNDIRPGDLIFPMSRYESDGFGHVMMYIGGDKAIAASRSGVPIGVVSMPRDFRATRWS